MTRYPTPDEAMDGLGDKVVQAISDSIVAAAADLAEYRRLAPQFVSRHSARGLANWIHDMAWAHVLSRMDGINNVLLVDSGPTREVQVAGEALYRVRLKRHSSTGSVRGYPTPAMLGFIRQDEPDLLSLVDFAQINLCVGYEWDALTRSMVGPVMTLRDGSFEEVVWMVDLPTVGGAEGGTVAPISTPDGPALPAIKRRSNAEAPQTGGSDQS